MFISTNKTPDVRHKLLKNHVGFKIRFTILKHLKIKINNINLPNAQWSEGYKRILKINNLLLFFPFCFLYSESRLFDVLPCKYLCANKSSLDTIFILEINV